jgi:hypothetical protein
MSLLKTISIVHPSGSTNNITNDSSGNVTVGNNLTVTGGLVPSSSFMRNRIINGAMVIDQRNAGAQISNAAGANWVVDRWNFTCSLATKFNIKQNLNSVTPPAGFSNYLGFQVTNAVTVGSAEYFFLGQPIEGFNTADLDFGKATAKTVTLSFWVQSSLTGSFGGSLQANASVRAYAFNYTISSANTWEYKTITVPGDVTGTWVGATNGIGINLYLGLGVGSNYTGTANTWSGSNTIVPTGAVSLVATASATFYITGVQLEVGSVATPFEQEIYSNTLAKCQRYFALVPMIGTCIANSTTALDFMTGYPVQMRSSATITARSLVTVTDSNVADYSQSSAGIGSVITSGATSAYIRFGSFTGLTTGKTYNSRTADQFVNASAEL